MAIDLLRRKFLFDSAWGFGSLALLDLLNSESRSIPRQEGRRKVTSGILHHPPKAKRVVQLFMAGAASHIDLFDYKPALEKHHGEPSDFGEKVEA
ncbi:MAG: DUF1501 domain-containing protein, partial [Planctomycetaceae bacterium]|nr:DUF1501 domain-containing protein [Planctomycetaceae bacterium]